MVVMYGSYVTGEVLNIAVPVPARASPALPIPCQCCALYRGLFVSILTKLFAE